jgi:hypothetical protein
MLGPEIAEVLTIFQVGIGLLVGGQLDIIPLLCSIGLRFKWLLACRIQLLPSVTDQLRNLGEGEVLLFDLFPDLVGKDHVGGRRPLRRVLVWLRMPTIFSLGFYADCLRCTCVACGAVTSPVAVSKGFINDAAIQALEWHSAIFCDSTLKFLELVSVANDRGTCGTYPAMAEFDVQLVTVVASAM